MVAGVNIHDFRDEKRPNQVRISKGIRVHCRRRSHLKFTCNSHYCSEGGIIQRKQNVIVMTGTFAEFMIVDTTRDHTTRTVGVELVRLWFGSFVVPKRAHKDQDRYREESSIINQLRQIYGIIMPCHTSAVWAAEALRLGTVAQQTYFGRGCTRSTVALRDGYGLYGRAKEKKRM